MGPQIQVLNTALKAAVPFEVELTEWLVKYIGPGPCSFGEQAQKFGNSTSAPASPKLPPVQSANH
jgi:hypothetical protein